MSGWRDPQTWASLVDGSTCPICAQGRPWDVVAELEASWLTMQEAAPVRGYVCLVARTHTVELDELPESEAQAFMRDIRLVSYTLRRTMGAVKLNYEIHGNTLPHLHMHFFPRYIGDAFEGKPIDPRSVVQPTYRAGEFAALRARLTHALKENAA